MVTIMKNKNEMLSKYAKLVANTGINVQKGQTAIIRVSVESIEFARMVAKECWIAGAGNVVVQYGDSMCDRLKYEYGEVETISKVPQWQIEQQIDYPAGEACYISIVGDGPDVFKGLDGQKVGTVLNARKHALAPFHDLLQKNENQWCVVAAPSTAWATKLFPDKTEEDAVDALWDAIFICMRLYDENPVQAWKKHSQTLENNSVFLNESGITSLTFKNNLGTNLVVELAEDFIWCGGDSKTISDVVFQANMPTEEVFSMPHRDKVNGTVVSSLPLNYQGSLIENFTFTFKNGEVVAYTAESGLDTLEMMLNADPGCKRLGEVALVPYSSPIRQTGVLFLNTLFDENASCHLALGSAYPDNMKNWAELSPEERTTKGYNKSVSHVDFMFGSADMSVVGTRADGSTIDIFVNGEWAI